MILRARLVVPMRRPPIEDGAVRVEGSTIMQVGSFKEMTGANEMQDLGDVVLLPGLINAHCHLDYTGLRHALKYRGSFTGWIRSINAMKRQQEPADYARAVIKGRRELLRHGTTSVLNLEAFPELLPGLASSPLKVWWCYEMLDLRRRETTGELIDGALRLLEPAEEEPGGYGLSPHAPFTASKALYQMTMEFHQAHPDCQLTTHLAESVEELEMFRDGSGEMHDFLASLGRDMSDCGGTTPVQWFAKAGLLRKDVPWIIAHLNEWTEADRPWLEAAPGHVVHCPGTHAYFQRTSFRHAELRGMGWNICLGTDSLASNERLDLFREMRIFRNENPPVDPETVLEMVTLNPARAMGQAGRLGQLSPGAAADLIAVPVAPGLPEVYEEITSTNVLPIWRMIDGNILTAEL